MSEQSETNGVGGVVMCRCNAERIVELERNQRWLGKLMALKNDGVEILCREACKELTGHPDFGSGGLRLSKVLQEKVARFILDT